MFKKLIKIKLVAFFCFFSTVYPVMALDGASIAPNKKCSLHFGPKEGQFCSKGYSGSDVRQ